MGLDHIGYAVPPAKFKEVVDWYLAALAPLGYTKKRDLLEGKVVGLGNSDTADFWLAERPDVLLSPTPSKAALANLHNRPPKLVPSISRSRGMTMMRWIISMQQQLRQGEWTMGLLD